MKRLSFKDDGPGFYRQITKVNGNSVGVHAQIEYGTYAAAGKVGKEPYGSHLHDFDQVLLWLGTDMNDLSELGAEVEICLGEGKNQEKPVRWSEKAILEKSYRPIEENVLLKQLLHFFYENFAH